MKPTTIIRFWLLCVVVFLSSLTALTQNFIDYYEYRYVCQCFCMASTYELDNDRFAGSLDPPSFGQGFGAIPFSQLGTLIAQRQIYLLSLHTSAFGTQTLREYNTAIVANSPPRLTIAERERLLDRITRGKYLQLKRIWEQTGSFRTREQMDALWLANGFSQKENNKLATAVVYNDRRRYSSPQQKMYVWNRRCAKECVNTLKSDPATFYFKNHQELSFLKPIDDPYEYGNWVTTEPIHAGEMGLIPGVNNPERQKWTKAIDARYRHVLNGLRDGRPFNSCNNLWKDVTMEGGVPATWQELLIHNRIRRHPAEMDFPDFQLTTYEVADDGNVEFTRGFADEPFLMPVKMPKDQWIDMNPTSAILLKLRGGPSNRHPIDWPQGAPPILAEPVSTQFKFTARVRGNPSIGYKVVSLFSGVPSAVRSGLTEFLHVYLDEEEETALRTGLTTVILRTWTKPVIAQYLEKGIPAAGRRGGKKKLSERFQVSSRKFGLGSLGNDSWNAMPLPDLGHLRYIEVDYIGQFFASCWQALNKNFVIPENQLPLSADIEREDGLTAVQPIEAPSVAVAFVGRSGAGLSRLSDGVKGEFIAEMKQILPAQHKVIVRVLFNQFHAQDPVFLDRNTCKLDGHGLDVAIGEYCKLSSLYLYSSRDASNAAKLPLTLEGSALQKATGQYMAKCFGRVLPSAIVTRLKGSPPVPYRWECVDFRNEAYALVERGPLMVK